MRDSLAYGDRDVCVSRMVDYIPFYKFHTHNEGTAVAQWLRCCVTIRKVASSIPDGVIGICH